MHVHVRERSGGVEELGVNGGLREIEVHRIQGEKRGVG